MPDCVVIADELLAEVLDAPGDRQSVEQALSRPDPFDSFTADFLKWAETCPMDKI